MDGPCTWGRVPGCHAENFRVVLNQNTIVQNGHMARLEQSPFGTESRCIENDVVTLPLAGFAGGIDQRWLGLIERTGLAIEVSRVFERVENLNLVLTHQINTAVASPLAFAFDLFGSGPFNVELAVTKTLFR